METAQVADDSYLALRQGGFSVVERGDTKLGNGAGVLAVPVPHSDWRMAAGLPDSAGAPFGLGAIACAVVAG